MEDLSHFFFGFGAALLLLFVLLLFAFVSLVLALTEEAFAAGVLGDLGVRGALLGVELALPGAGVALLVAPLSLASKLRLT